MTKKCGCNCNFFVELKTEKNRLDMTQKAVFFSNVKSALFLSLCFNVLSINSFLIPCHKEEKIQQILLMQSGYKILCILIKNH